jgi:hypothetical protein
MTTGRAAAGDEADPDLNPSDRPETDHPGAKPADPTAPRCMVADPEVLGRNAPYVI